MTRDNLIKFLQQNYEPDEELLWQTLSFADVEGYAELASAQTWQNFVEKQEYYGEIADNISDLVVEKYQTYLEEN